MAPDVLPDEDDPGLVDGHPTRWQVPEHDWSDHGNPHENVPPRYGLSVTAVSATLPNGFSREMGMDARIIDYPSPFDADLAALASPYTRDPRRPRFDTARHPAWAARLIEALVSANGGSALVLSATATAGKLYAAHLRAVLAGTGITVHSQWDGVALRQITAEWRDDHGSVLVGTKSLMTGTDAPGATCTLVILDRIPRAAGNPVDDARVEAITEALGIDKWAADRLVYVSDASLLLTQAVGRLVRAMDDSGMVAVLDPRLLKTGPFRYEEKTRQVYMQALHRFDRKLSDLEAAKAFLTAKNRASAA